MTTAKNFNQLRSWLKQAGALPEKEDEGKPATTGAHAADNKSDLKTVPGANIETGTKNPVDGNADSPVPDSGLQQTTSGKMPDVEKAVKIVSEESAKAANADLDDPIQFAAAVASISKAAAAMPQLFASAGMRVDQPVPVAAKVAGVAQPATPAHNRPLTQKEAADQAVQAIVAGYQKWGSDRGDLTARFLLGFQGTYDALYKQAAGGEMEAMMAQDAGAVGPGDPAAVAGAPGPDAAAGGAPPMPPAPGGAPDAGGAPGGPGGEGGQPSLDDIAAALGEMGLSADDLMQIAQKMQGGVEQDPAAAPAEKAAALQVLANLQKTAADTKALMRSGKFALKPAADGSPERKRRDAAKGYIRELYAASN